LNALYDGMYGQGFMAAERKKITIGAAVVVSFLFLFAFLYAASYPLTSYAEGHGLHLLFTSPTELFYAAMAVAGIALIALYRKSLKAGDALIGLLLAVLVWLAIQAKYWYHGWSPYVPFYDPTFHAVETFLMVLGAIVLIRGHHVLSSKAAEGKYTDVAKSVALGIALGVPFAIVNVLIFMCVYGETATIENIFYMSVVALQPGILEEVAYRLLFMSLALVILRKYLPAGVAAIASIAMAVVFHAFIHVPALLLTDPVAALVTVAVMSLAFGLPMAILAYKRDIESAMGFHWTIDALRFSMGF
jgi:hypothetical protein